MLYFTKYANEKFDILNKHKVYLRREQIESAVCSPDKEERRGKYLAARKEGIKVIYKKEDAAIKIITFYPVK